MQEIICNFFHNLLGISWIIQMLVAHFPFIYFSKLDKAMRKNYTSNLLKSLYNRKKISFYYPKNSWQKIL